MKFKKGTWFLSEGMNIVTPKQIREYQIKDNKITCFVPCQNIENRSDTLNGPMLTYEFSSPASDIIKVKILHYKGRSPFDNNFEFISQNNAEMLIHDTPDNIIAESGNAKLIISKNGPISYSFYYDEIKLTSVENQCTYYVKDSNGKRHISEQLDLGIGECIYGLGEKFTHFVKNGQSFDSWNQDSGTNSEQSYKNIPFYISSNNYGVFINNPGRVSFEIGTQRVDKVQFSVPYEGMEYYVICGSSMKNIISSYTSLTGRAPILPKWTYGLWLSTSFTTDYNEKIVSEMLIKSKKEKLPVSVFHYDCFWMTEMEWCNFTWDEATFPEPEEMLKRIKSSGVKICVWINPYIAQKSPLFDICMDKGYFIKTKDGHVYQPEEWQAGMGIVDFTNPEATEWYKNQLRPLIKMGVDAFKTDFGERIPASNENVVFFNNADSDKMHNYYSYLYNKAVHEVLAEEKGEEQAVLFARAATAGCQAFPIHWGGDCWSTYSAMAETLRGGLSLALCGFSYWSHDIGGFEDHASPDIYKRWVAFGLLSSHSRLHGSKSYRVPWEYDEESVDVLRFFTKLKYKLMPYIYNLSIEASCTGIPIIRPMVLEYPDDRNCRYIDTQYMLGDKLLVAPIFNSEGLAQYYLPEGSWINIINHKCYTGGRWIDESMDYFTLPLMMKSNSILLTKADNESPEYNFESDFVLLVYELQDGFSERITIVDKQTTNNIDVYKNKGILSINSDLKSLTVCILPEATSCKIIDGNLHKPYNEL